MPDLGELLSLSETMKNAVLDVANATQVLEDHWWSMIDSALAHVQCSMSDMSDGRRMLVQMASNIKNMSMQFPEPSRAHTLLKETVNILKENVNVLQEPLKGVDKAGHAGYDGGAKRKPVENSKKDRKKEPNMGLYRKRNGKVYVYRR